MLTKEILNENHHLDIPEATLENEVYMLVQDLLAKPGFDPNLKFDVEKHLAYDPTKKVNKFSFEDLNIHKTHVPKLSPVAGVKPFQLFTQEAVDMMKYEVFSNLDLLRKYGRLSATGHGTSDKDFVVSGFIEETPFCRSVWTHPKVLEIISELLEVDLYMPHIFSHGHVNASLTPRKKGEDVAEENDEELANLKKLQDENADKIPSAITWHYDSTPAVCVMMLSAPDNMIGGETGIRDGEEKIARVPDPKPGQATLLQGRVIKHIATKPLNRCDRISYVVGLHPKNPDAYDSTCATSERPGAVPTFTNDRFYPHFLNYRFDRVKQRMDNYQQMLMANYYKGEKFDQMGAIDFMKDIEDYLNRTWRDFEAISDVPYPPPLFKIPYKEL